MLSRKFVAILTSALLAAVVGAAIPLGYEIMKIKPLTEANISLSQDFENGSLLVFIRNRSEQPLDIVAVDLALPTKSVPAEVVEAAYAAEPIDKLGSAPLLSQNYFVNGSSLTVRASDNRELIVLSFNVLQAIAPGEHDFFSFEWPSTFAEEVTQIGLIDIEGNRFDFSTGN